MLSALVGGENLVVGLGGENCGEEVFNGGEDDEVEAADA